MASLLIVETGEGLPNANSYASVGTIRVYAALRGVALPVAPTDPDVIDPVDILAIKGMDFLEALRSKYLGYQATSTQALSWPRSSVPGYSVGNSVVENGYENIIYDGTVYRPANVLPVELVNALCALVIAAHNGINLQPNLAADRLVIREKLGPIETEYSEGYGQPSAPTLPYVIAMLEPLLARERATLTYRG